VVKVTSIIQFTGFRIKRLCHNRRKCLLSVIPAKAGIKTLSPRRQSTSHMQILDSPVSSTGQAQGRASLVRNDKKEITTKSPSLEWKKEHNEDSR